MTKPNGHTAILVAGMHRSGTSALTGALGALGVALGKHLLAPGRDNPKGYWEHEGAVRIHEELLAALGRSWDDVRALPDGWQASAAADKARAGISALIERDFATAPLWAVKDPRMCRFLPLWLDAVQQSGARPVVMFMARHPAEVAASIKTRNHWAPAASELLWLRHVLEAEAASRAHARTAIVYDDLLAAPAATLATALSKVGVTLEGDGEAGNRALQRSVDAGDRHHRLASTPPASRFGALAVCAYDALVQTARGDDAWDKLQQCGEQFDLAWRTEGAAVDAIADMASQWQRRDAAARVELAETTGKLTAQVKWSEEAVAIRNALRDEYHLSLEAMVAARERNAAALQLAADRAAQLRDLTESDRAALVAGRDRLAAELESVAAQARSERADHESDRAALAAERDRLAAELESVAAQARSERADHESDRTALAAERDRLAAELSVTRSRAAEKHAHQISLLVEREQQQDELQDALAARAAEVADMRAAVAEMRNSTSWRITRPLRWLRRCMQRPRRAGH